LGVERDRNESDVLERIRDALSKNGSGASSLKTFAIHQARLAFYEESTGLFLVAPEADLEVSTGQNDVPHRGEVIVANLNARVEVSGQPAHIVANVNIPRDTSHVTGDMSVTGLNLNALAANAKFYSFLAPFALTTDISGSFALDHGRRFTLSDFGIDASGVVNGLGKPLHVKDLRVVGRYDGATGRLLIDDATLEGEQAHAHLRGVGNLAFDDRGVLSKASLQLVMDKMGIDMPGVMKQAVTLGRAALTAAYIPGQRLVTIDQAVVFGGPLSANFTGKIALGDSQSPGIDVDGKVNAIAVRDFLHYWPLQISDGPRNWIDTHVSAGRIGPIVLHTHIAPGALDRPALPEDAVAMTIPISGATVSYVQGLTPLTGVSGSAVLSGDTFKGDVASASIGPLVVSKAHLAIPNLHVVGPTATITAHVDGSVPDVLALIDEKPLQYPSRFHVKTLGAKGAASIDAIFQVPTRHNSSMDDIGIAVHANLTGLALAVGEHTKITNGTANLAVDNASLHAVGTVTLGSTNVGIDWTEAFKAQGPISTRMTVKGTLDDNARAALNLRTGNYLTGPIGAVALLEGSRGTIQRAQVTLDLTPAAINLDLINFKKPIGVASSALMVAKLDNDGNLRSEDVSLSGAGLSAKGTASLGPGGDLEHLDIPVVHAGAANDFALKLTRTPATGFDLAISGRSLDGTALGHKDPNDNDTPASGAASAGSPFHVAIHVDRLVLREGVAISPFAVDVAGQGDRPRSMSLSGTLSKGVQVTGGIADDGTARHVTLETSDAGQLLKGLFGLDAMKGGKLNVAAAMPPMSAAIGKDPNAIEYSGALTIDDFTIVNQPFLARMFSSGSFGGVADLLRGQGIVIDKLQMPFAVHGDVFDIHEARASGPSIGVTADGYVDRRNNQLALKGALAPLYGINSVLGAIPIVGQVLVSRKGEGIIGMTYSATGPADEPQVNMNPLSVLTPGILRRIFQGSIPSAPPAQANTAPPPADKTQ
ncbi:MAG: AsmA-like C-terminal domain-containing protein, partial [Rhizomicrobium sp.]